MARRKEYWVGASDEDIQDSSRIRLFHSKKEAENYYQGTRTDQVPRPLRRIPKGYHVSEHTLSPSGRKIAFLRRSKTRAERVEHLRSAGYYTRFQKEEDY